MTKKLTLYLLLIYKKHVSPTFGVVFGQACRYNPSCGDYCYQAVNKYGPVKGLMMGTKRILRCNPFSRGGHDPV